MTGILILLSAGAVFADTPPGELRWTMQKSESTARLRGVSAVSERIAWASGSESTVLRTEDGGMTWRKIRVTTDIVDFRDIDAIDDRTAYILSIGPGALSRIYKTSDAGANWTEQYRGNHPGIFLNAMSFWDAENGLAFGDSIAGEFMLLTTENGGRTWDRLSTGQLPRALENEGAFAASGTNIAVFGKSHAWIATGGASKSRVLFTHDRGRSWEIVETPLAAGPSSGSFSITFRNEALGMIVGGDYKQESEAVDNLAITQDGGKTWRLAKGLTGYRSAVAGVTATDPPLFVAVGPGGADYSTDDGATWQSLPGPGYDTLSFAGNQTLGWGAGAQGRIGLLTITRHATSRGK